MEYYNNNNYRQFISTPTNARGELQPEITRITRLILEALEISFSLCNFSFDRYGLNKLFDVVNQILPTAYVLNTSYWMFYSSQNGNCICICTRFGIRCPHLRNGLHWINLAPIPEAHEKFFFTLETGGMPHPSDVNIFVEPIISDIVRAFNVSIRLTIQTIFRNGNKLTGRNNKQATLLIESRYLLTPQYYPLHTTLAQFRPHPTTHPNYAKYFETLKKLGERDNTLWEQILTPRTITIISPDKPNFRLLPNPEAHPVFYQTTTPTVINWSRPFNTFYGNFTSSPSIIVNGELETNAQYIPPTLPLTTNPPKNRTPKKQQNMPGLANNSESPRRPNYYPKSKDSAVPNVGPSSRQVSPSQFIQSEYSYISPVSTITPISSEQNWQNNSYYLKNAQGANISPSKTPTSQPSSRPFTEFDYEKSFQTLPSARHLTRNPDVMDNKISSTNCYFENPRKDPNYANSFRDFERTRCDDAPYQTTLPSFEKSQFYTSLRASMNHFRAAIPTPPLSISNENFEKAYAENFRKVACTTPVSIPNEDFEKTTSSPMCSSAENIRRAKYRTPIPTVIRDTSNCNSLNNSGTAQDNESSLNENLKKNSNLEPSVILTEKLEDGQCSTPIPTSPLNNIKCENVSDRENTPNVKNIDKYQVFQDISNSDYLDMVVEYIAEDETKEFVRGTIVRTASYENIYRNLTEDIARFE